MGFVAIASLVLLASLTVLVDARRFRAVTPLMMLTLSNLLWSALNPSVWLFSPPDARYFGTLVSLVAEATDDGVTRVLVAANCFQLGLAAVAVYFAARRETSRFEPLALSESLTEALYRLAAILLFLGVVGVALLGFRFNGSPLGLYDLGYGKRTEFIYGVSVLSFMLDLVHYGASVLITALILRGRTWLAMLVLLGIILHATLMKSKFPILWVSMTFATAAFLSGRFRLRRMTSWLPLLMAGAVLASLSFARSAKEQDLAGMFEQVATGQDAYQKTVGTIWEDDFPGAAAASYIVVNTEQTFNMAPLRETVMVFVPRFIYDRGPSQSDEFAARILGARTYFAGAGISWSPICDGYRLCGFVGVTLISLILALLGHSLTAHLRAPVHSLRERSCVLACLCAPCFILASRTGLAGSLKAITITVAIGFLPTRWLGYRPDRAEPASRMMEGAA